MEFDGCCEIEMGEREEERRGLLGVVVGGTLDILIS